MIKKIFNKIKSIWITCIGKRMKYKISVMDNYTSLKLIKDQQLSVIRFGDGEFDIIRGNNIPYQDYNHVLANEMKELILKGNTNDVLICLPDVFQNISRYTKSCKAFFYQNFFYQNRKFLQDIENTKNQYGSTFISRPYIDLKDKSNSREYFEELKSLWKGKDILIVEGKYTRSGEGNDLFANANTISRIIVPSKNAFTKVKEIEKAIHKYSDDRLILLMVGPTAKIIISDLKIKNDLPNQMIDIGHIDSEYEWLRMGAKEKVKIPHKHTAEFNNDDDKVVLINDKSYLNEVKKIIN